MRLESALRARGARSGGKSDSVAFDAALGASDESKFLSDQEFIPDGGVSTLMAAFPA